MSTAWWVLAGALLVAATVCCWLTARNTDFTAGHRQAAAWTSVLVVVALAVTAHVVVLSYQYKTIPDPQAPGSDPNARTKRFRRRGLKAAIMGADGRASTSKTQIVLWTGALIAGLVDLLLLTRSVSGGTLFTDAVTKNWRPEYLVLLGLPAGAATIAKVSVSESNGGQGPTSHESAAKIADARRKIVADPTTTLADHLADSPSAFDVATAVARTGTRRVYHRDSVPAGVKGFARGVAELLTSDSGEVSWPDLQYVAFTLITLTSFAAQLLASPSSGLPPVPAALLTLMGVSATAYTANKALETRGSPVGP